MAEFRIRIWNRHFEEPLTVEMTGASAEDVTQRFEHVCETVTERRAAGDALVFVSWNDVAGGEGFTIEPANVSKVEALGPDLEVAREF